MSNNKVLFLFGLLLTGIGIFLLPVILTSISSKYYRTTIKSKEIDFNNLGPEIRKKD